MENQNATNDKKQLENMMHENEIFICTSINNETTNKMTAKLIEYVNKLKPVKPDIVKKYSTKIISPYDEWPEEQPVLEVHLQTPGGVISVAHSILTLLNMARAKGAIIKTINLSEASSAGSFIAVSGTKGYRYMSQTAMNAIHFGTRPSVATRDGELGRYKHQLDATTNILKNIYLQNTKLTQKEINKYYTYEGTGFLNAKQCLEKGICDYVITTDGQYVNNPALLQDITKLKGLSR